MIEAGRTQRNHSRAACRQPLEDRRVEVVIDERAYGGESRRQRTGIGGQPWLEIDDVVSAVRIGLIEELAVEGMSAEKGDPHATA
jgi:hypothetical protein